MANNVTDAFLGALFTVSTATMVGVADVQLLSYNLSDILWSGYGVELTLATIFSLVAVAVAWFQNNPSWARFTDEQKALVGGTLALVALGTFTNVVADFAGASIVIGLAVIGIQAGGYWAVAQSS